MSFLKIEVGKRLELARWSGLWICWRENPAAATALRYLLGETRAHVLPFLEMLDFDAIATKLG